MERCWIIDFFVPGPPGPISRRSEGLCVGKAPYFFWFPRHGDSGHHSRQLVWQPAGALLRAQVQGAEGPSLGDGRLVLVRRPCGVPGSPPRSDPPPPHPGGIPSNRGGSLPPGLRACWALRILVVHPHHQLHPMLFPPGKGGSDVGHSWWWWWSTVESPELTGRSLRGAPPNLYFCSGFGALGEGAIFQSRSKSLQGGGRVSDLGGYRQRTCMSTSST